MLMPFRYLIRKQKQGEKMDNTQELKAHLQDNNKARMYEEKKKKDNQIQIIKNICQDHLDNTDIDNINLCEDFQDHYLLGKVDMATEIFESMTSGKRCKGKGYFTPMRDKK